MASAGAVRRRAAAAHEDEARAPQVLREAFAGEACGQVAAAAPCLAMGIEAQRMGQGGGELGV
jgi:hypothetical protein